MGKPSLPKGRAQMPQSYPRRDARAITVASNLPSRTPSPAEHELTLTYASAQRSGHKVPAEIYARITLVQFASLSASSGTL